MFISLYAVCIDVFKETIRLVCICGVKLEEAKANQKSLSYLGCAQFHSFNSCWHLTFMSRKNSILGLSEPEKAEFLDIFKLMSI